MASPVFKVLIILGFFTAGAIFLNPHNHSVKEIAENNQLNEEQASAFLACRKQMNGKGLETRNAHGVVKRNTMPDEICVCQARSMAEMFKPGQFEDHRVVVEHWISGARFQALPVSVLKQRPAQPGDAARALAQHLANCIIKYQQEQEAKTEAVKQQLLLRQHNAHL